MRTDRSDLQIEEGARPASPPQPPSFREIFDSELSFVWNSLRRFGVASSDLEDVAHEVFVVVHRKLAEIDPSRPIRPWLFAIAFRAASDYRKRAFRRREALLGEDIDRPDSSDGIDVVLEHRQEKNLARRALLEVPQDRRAVIVLHDFEEVSMHEVAAALRIPLKTAYSRLRVGREELIASARRLREEGT